MNADLQCDLPFECLKLSYSEPMIITFDLSLWIKATRIVLETGMRIVVRLEVFHILKIFLGCIVHRLYNGRLRSRGAHKTLVF